MKFHSSFMFILGMLPVYVMHTSICNFIFYNYTIAVLVKVYTKDGGILHNKTACVDFTHKFPFPVPSINLDKGIVLYWLS